MEDEKCSERARRVLWSTAATSRFHLTNLRASHNLSVFGLKLHW